MGITFNNKHSWNDFKLHVNLVSFPLLPSFKENEVDIPGMNGVIDFTTNILQDALIEFECGFEIAKGESKLEKAMQIGSWLKTNGRASLILDELPSLTFDARIANKVDLESTIMQIGKFNLIFKCTPNFY
jgi:predicted phage tail component-like protein